MTDGQRRRLADYLKHFKLDENMDAAGLMAYFREHYSIPESFTDKEARLAAGVRYELEARELFRLPDYVFAEDVDSGLIALVLEKAFPGVSVKTSSVRDSIPPTPPTCWAGLA
jgi:hypothetical protein